MTKFQSEGRNTPHPTSEPADRGVEAGMVIDIQAELAYWDKAYRSGGFHRPGFVFKDYLPSLKFAYDTYLRCHRQPLETLLPALHHKYLQTVPAAQRLDWQCMSHLVVAVWRRLLRAGTSKTEAKAPGPGAAHKTAASLRGTVARLRNISTRDASGHDDPGPEEPAQIRAP